MDEDFAYFLEKFGPPVECRHVPRSSIETFRGKLPDQLLAYWNEHGWCGYADGLFWTVDPEAYEPALDAWIGDTPFMERDAYHLIARSAFGHLYFWGERTGNSLTILAPDACALYRHGAKEPDTDPDFALRSFFAFLQPKSMDIQGEKERLFRPAKERWGRLRSDEMYGFVPALALGGTADAAHVKKVKAVEHLVMLAQLADLKTLTTDEG